MTDSPYRAFKEKLCTFADGQAGIRNPFVIWPSNPLSNIELLTDSVVGRQGPTSHQSSMKTSLSNRSGSTNCFPQTKVYNLCVALGSETSRNASRARCRTGSPKSSSKR